MKRGWTNREVADLKRLYPTAPWPEMVAALPRHDAKSIRAYASRLGIKRQRQRCRDVDPLVAHLVDLRINAGISKAEAARLAGLDRSVLSASENGRFVGLRVLRKWCAAFGMKIAIVPEDFVGG